jgi:hypothetical protein
MTQLLIQPSAGPEAQRHFQDTIRTAVRFSDYAHLVGPQLLSHLDSLFPVGNCAMWGLVPGHNESNRSKWERIEIGDVVVFTGNKKIFAIGEVADKFHSPELALALWGTDDNNATWEYMYALKDVVETDIPYQTFNALLGDSPKNNHMGFRLVDDERATPFLQYIGSSIPQPQPTVSEIVQAIKDLEFSDIQVIVDEWDTIGREEFLKSHSLSGAFKYLLKWGDKTYDAKAIAVQALRAKHLAMAHLRGNAFQGDATTIAGPLRNAGWEVIDKIDLDSVEAEEQQEKDIRDRVGIGPVEKQQLVKSRRGQGVFRHNVMIREKSCRVTGIINPEHLRASHIKPWSKSNDNEKLDGNNGLMLAPHIDHLFDKGWITFADSGELMLSEQGEPQVFLAFGVSADMNVGSFTDEQITFLNFHRTNIFRK